MTGARPPPQPPPGRWGDGAGSAVLVPPFWEQSWGISHPTDAWKR